MCVIHWSFLKICGNNKKLFSFFTLFFFLFNSVTKLDLKLYPKVSYLSLGSLKNRKYNNKHLSKLQRSYPNIKKKFVFLTKFKKLITLNPYLIMMSVKQGGIKYHFLSLWYDPTWDLTLVSQTISQSDQ